MIEMKTKIDGKKVLGIAGLIAFLENGKFVYLTNEKISDDDFCDETFTLSKNKEYLNNYEQKNENSKSLYSDKTKTNNYRGKNFNPNYNQRNSKQDNLDILKLVEEKSTNIDNKEEVKFVDYKKDEIKENKNIKIINEKTKLVRKEKVLTEEERESKEFKDSLNYSGGIKKI